MFFFYYCLDDWLAQTFNNPALGEVPWVVILCLHLVLIPFTSRVSLRSKYE